MLALVEGWKLDKDGNVSEIKLAPKSRGVDLAARYHRLIVERTESLNIGMELDLGSMTTQQLKDRFQAPMKEMDRAHERAEDT